jgi:hypothetical protein
MDHHSRVAENERCPRCGGQVERGKKHSCRAENNPSNDGEKNPRKSSPSEDDIRKRAYELYVARGGESGHDLDDWLRAECEVSGGSRMH